MQCALNQRSSLLLSNPQEEIEHSQSICLAVRTISSLLVNSMLRPQPGNPTNSSYQQIPRHGHKDLPFLKTPKGKKLLALRWLVEREIQAMASKTYILFCFVNIKKVPFFQV